MHDPSSSLLGAAAFILAVGMAQPVAGATCSNVWPSYWQDPSPKFAPMWVGQVKSNTPPSGWRGPVFRLSDRYPTTLKNEKAEQPWRTERFDALFDTSTRADVKTRLAREYIWAVMRYIQDGNISNGDTGTDWTLCDNPVRSWYHMPFQTYDVLSGREFVHGLTREAPVTFNVRTPDHPGASVSLPSTMWAVAFYNPTAAYTLGTVWKRDGTVARPVDGLIFADGAVIGKPLFNTSTPDQLPFLKNMPAWNANISDPSFCNCTPAKGQRQCSMIEQSEQCPRSTTLWPKVRLIQFDVGIKDSRAKGTAWVFGTFVADGQRKAGERNPWNRISPLGLMWGNDTPPPGELAAKHPNNPRRNGFAEEVIFWDTVDMLNAVGGEKLAQRPGHLGCNSRLNGPADNPNSSCMSCHMTASLHDKNLATPPIIAQFRPKPKITFECVSPSTSGPTRGTDAQGTPAKVVDGITFSEMDGIYFANLEGGEPVNMTVPRPDGPKNVLGNEPDYGNGRKRWIPLDFSLQMSIALVQWGQWQQHKKTKTVRAIRRFEGRLPAR